MVQIYEIDKLRSQKLARLTEKMFKCGIQTNKVSIPSALSVIYPTSCVLTPSIWGPSPLISYPHHSLDVSGGECWCSFQCKPLE
jgi:hypothetical protein